MKIVGICGHDFCGSTLLARLFAQIPSVASGGELRWLLTDPGRRGRCSVCKGCCPIFDSELLISINERNLYAKVAKKFGKSTLVSSDKGQGHYERYARGGKMAAIILFRSPEGAASSDKKHLTTWPIVKRDTVQKSVDEWHTVYRKLCSWAPRFCDDHVFLCYEDLVSDHASVMARLCERLEIPLVGNEFSSGCLTGDYHSVLGNPSAHKSAAVRPDTSWERRLSAREKEEVKNSAWAQKLYETMRVLSV